MSRIRSSPTKTEKIASSGREVFGVPRAVIERLAFCHLIILLIFSSWALGGNIFWVQRALSYLGNAGLIITVFEGWRRHHSSESSMSPFWILVPWIALNILAALSTLHPSFKLMSVEGAHVFIPTAVSPWLPSTARADFTWSSLWLFDALFIPAYNLFVAIRSRQMIRLILLVFAGNGVLLAIFGTLQKLSRASGLYFGHISSPNRTFFATFIYDNHWGAFTILTMSVAIGLIFRRSHFSSIRDFLNSPAFGGSLAVLLLAASVPLSSSRSCTALVLIVLTTALLHALRRIVAIQRSRSQSGYKPLLFVFIGSSLTFIAIYALARPVIDQRVEQTRRQLASFEQTHSFGARAELYRDTWKMISERPLFGWGLGSYGTSFVNFNTQEAVDRLPQFYEDAHSDWLQTLAEIGFIGAALRVAMVLISAVALWRGRPWKSLPLYSIFGCGLILLYAWLEFPFGNTAVTLAWWTCWFSAVRLTQLDARDAAH